MELLNYALLDDQGQFVAERAFKNPPPAHKAQFLRPLVATDPAPQPWQVTVGHSYDVQPAQVVKVWQYADRALSEIKRARKDEVNVLYRAKLAAGVEYPTGSGRRVQIDDESRDNIGTVGSEARWSKLAGSGWPADFAWRMLDNGHLPLPTPDDMIALGEAAKAAFLTIRRKHWQHKDAIDALQSAQAVAEYDIAAGW